MAFPSYLGLGPWSVHPHIVFEVLGYVFATQLVLLGRRLHPDFLDATQRGVLFAAALVGGVFGAKVLYWLVDPAVAFASVGGVLGGQTVVGALLGAQSGIELAKRFMGIVRRTGDLYAVPVAVGIMVGRVGCFFSGLPDRTHGTPTTLPWGVDFGDGVARHPLQVYEIMVLAVLLAVLVNPRTRHWQDGSKWRVFLGGYLVWRLVGGFLTPLPQWVGLTSLQWAALAYIAFEGWRIVRGRRRGLSASEDARARQAPNVRAREL